MISIVICSLNQKLTDDLKKNISNTIGVEYEIIVINNENSQHSIFSAYNIGVKRSKGSIICFCHEDIKFHTKDWGKNINRHFLDKDIGMIGIIGANIYPKSPSPWWSDHDVVDHLVNVIQHWPQSNTNHNPYSKPYDGNENISIDYSNPTGEVRAQASGLDGLWFCIKKELFDKIEFDEKTYSGFHFYDSDISLQVQQHAKIYVVFDILLEHFSAGDVNSGKWVEACIAFNRKWKDYLPIRIKDIPEEQYIEYEANTLLRFAYWAQSSGISDSVIKNILSENLSIIANCKTNSYLKIKYWATIGYQLSRIPIFIHKVFGCKK
jgi:hypothetical protein